MRIGEEANFNVEITPQAPIGVVIGDNAKMDVVKAVNYIESGKKEIEKAVEDGKADFDDHAADKTQDFDDNAVNKTNAFNQNAVNKTQDFDDNAAIKQAAIDASAAEAKQWAIGDPTEPDGYSAKYWAGQAAGVLSNAVTLNTAQTISESKTFTKQIFATLASYSATNGSSNANPYKKIGECVLTGANQTVVVPFVYSRTNSAASNTAYLGRIIFSVGNTAGTLTENSSGILLSILPDYIDNGNAVFYLCYKNNTPESNQVTCQIWVYIKSTYQGVNIMPLRQGTGGTTYSTTNITWGNNIVQTSELPADYTSLIQKKIVIYTTTPSTSDNSTKIATTAYVKNNLANYVTTNTNQTITSEKTVSGTQFKVSNANQYKLLTYDTRIDRGVAPQAWTGMFPYLLIDGNGKRLSGLYCTYDTSMKNTISLIAYKGTSTDSTDYSIASLEVGYDSSTRAYAKAPTPFEDTTSSTQIDTVGARNTKLQSYVSLSGTETIPGDKDFTGTVTAVTQTAGDNSTKVATTAYVDSVTHIIETYHSGADWYRVWSDGWCEQGGTYDSGSDQRNVTTALTFHKAFADTDYCLTFMSVKAGSGNYVGYIGASQISTTGASIQWYGHESTDQARYLKWRAEGYITLS